LTHHRQADLWTFGKNPLKPPPVDREYANISHCDQRRHAGLPRNHRHLPDHLSRSPSCQFQSVVAVRYADLDLSRHHDMHFTARVPLRRDQLSVRVEIFLRRLSDTHQIGRVEFGEKRHLGQEQNPLH
jgi:hypothetical protein